MNDFDAIHIHQVKWSLISFNWMCKRMCVCLCVHHFWNPGMISLVLNIIIFGLVWLFFQFFFLFFSSVKQLPNQFSCANVFFILFIFTKVSLVKTEQRKQTQSTRFWRKILSLLTKPFPSHFSPFNVNIFNSIRFKFNFHLSLLFCTIIPQRVGKLKCFQSVSGSFFLLLTNLPFNRTPPSFAQLNLA